MFEPWVRRRESANTQRAYREDVLAFVSFMGWKWPEDSTALLTVKVAEVLSCRDWLREKEAAPKTINRRISSLSGLFKFLAGVAAERRLPIKVGNPAHSQFIGRGATDPVEDRQALSATRARQLMGMPAGDSVLAARDRAILKCFLDTGARLGTICRLRVSDFHQEGDESTLRLHEKGNKRRTIGLHYAASQAIQEYATKAGLTGGPLFRPVHNSGPREPRDNGSDTLATGRGIPSTAAGLNERSAASGRHSV